MSTNSVGSPSPLVLVHGAWHAGWCFSALQDALDHRSVPSYAVDLPGHGASGLEATDLHGDADHVARVVRTLAARHDAPVTLVGHSYGGAVAGDALHDDIVGAGLVSALVYVAAFALHVGETVNNIVRNNRVDHLPLGAAIRMQPDGWSVLDPDLAIPALYGTTDRALVPAAIARLEPQRMANFDQAVRHSPFGGDPTTGTDRAAPHTVYVRCRHDGAVPLAQQDAMAPRCDVTLTLDTDHCPHVSATDELADALTEVASRHSGMRP